jgi:GNAT superfamily N-acetyltransferase
VPGLLAYSDGAPAGWVSLAPREEFGRLNRSRNLKAVDDQPVWSIVCFFIHRKHRNQGVASRLVEAAVEYAREHGAAAVEAYPYDTGEERVQSSSIFTGVMGMFLTAGFEEIARRAPKRPILRKMLKQP